VRVKKVVAVEIGGHLVKIARSRVLERKGRRETGLSLLTSDGLRVGFFTRG